MEMNKDGTIFCYDHHARQYDAYQTAVVPKYQEMLDMVGHTCHRYLEPGARIMDLGCGTGNASLAILREIPARIFLVDGSAKMLDVAKSKVECFRPGSIIGGGCLDLADKSWGHSLECGEFDAIVSTLVLEHLPFVSYRSTVENCYHLLKPGGWLIAVEGYEEMDSDMLSWFSQEMEARSAAFSSEASDFISQLRSEKEVHYYCSKAQKAAWWRDAGLSQVNVLWQYLCIALMAGRKPP